MDSLQVATYLSGTSAQACAGRECDRYVLFEDFAKSNMIDSIYDPITNEKHSDPRGWFIRFLLLPVRRDTSATRSELDRARAVEFIRRSCEFNLSLEQIEIWRNWHFSYLFQPDLAAPDVASAMVAADTERWLHYSTSQAAGYAMIRKIDKLLPQLAPSRKRTADDANLGPVMQESVDTI